MIPGGWPAAPFTDGCFKIRLAHHQGGEGKLILPVRAVDAFLALESCETLGEEGDAGEEMGVKLCRRGCSHLLPLSQSQDNCLYLVPGRPSLTSSSSSQGWLYMKQGP